MSRVTMPTLALLIRALLVVAASTLKWCAMTTVPALLTLALLARVFTRPLYAMMPIFAPRTLALSSLDASSLRSTVMMARPALRTLA
jgi:hypothetical protein